MNIPNKGTRDFILLSTKKTYELIHFYNILVLNCSESNIIFYYFISLRVTLGL